MTETKEMVLARTITDTLNTFTFDDGIFSDAMLNEHRTLQQNFMRLIKNYCTYVAEQPDYMFDGRNEASREFAKEVAKIDIALPLV